MFWQNLNYEMETSIGGEVCLHLDEAPQYFKMIIPSARIAENINTPILLLPNWLTEQRSCAILIKEYPRRMWNKYTDTDGFVLGKGENAQFSAEYTFSRFNETTFGKGRSVFARETVNDNLWGFKCSGAGVSAAMPPAGVPVGIKIQFHPNATMAFDSDIILLKGRIPQ